MRVLSLLMSLALVVSCSPDAGAPVTREAKVDESFAERPAAEIAEVARQAMGKARSYHVTAIEPAQHRGPYADLSIDVDGNCSGYSDSGFGRQLLTAGYDGDVFFKDDTPHPEIDIPTNAEERALASAIDAPPYAGHWVMTGGYDELYCWFPHWLSRSAPGVPVDSYRKGPRVSVGGMPTVPIWRGEPLGRSTLYVSLLPPHYVVRATTRLGNELVDDVRFTLFDEPVDVPRIEPNQINTDFAGPDDEQVFSGGYDPSSDETIKVLLAYGPIPRGTTLYQAMRRGLLVQKELRYGQLRAGVITTLAMAEPTGGAKRDVREGEQLTVGLFPP